MDVSLHAAGLFDRNQPLDNTRSLIATSYRVAIGIAGAWITARLAPTKPMKHALILGLIGTSLGLVGVVMTWDMGLGRGSPLARSIPEP